MMIFLVGALVGPGPACAEPALLAGPQPASAADATSGASEAEAAPHQQRPVQAGGVRYTVQVGSFRERANADALLAELTAVYEDGTIVESATADGALLRVVSGRFASLEGALTREQALRIHGFTTYVRRLAFPAAGDDISLQPLDGWRLVAERVDAAKR